MLATHVQACQLEPISHRQQVLLHTLWDLVHRNSCLTFSTTGRTLAAVGADQTVSLWDAATGQRLDSLQAHENRIYSIDVSLDGQTLASSGTDNIARLWDVRTPAQPARTLQGHAS